MLIMAEIVFTFFSFFLWKFTHMIIYACGFFSRDSCDFYSAKTFYSGLFCGIKVSIGIESDLLVSSID